MAEKKALEIEMLGWWIIAAIVLVVMIVSFLILKNKGINLIEYIKNIFRFK